MCIRLLLKNQYMKLPSGGSMLGYFFFFRASICAGDMCGPGKLLGAGRSIRDGWEGGLYLLGFSRTLGLRFTVDGGTV